MQKNLSIIAKAVSIALALGASSGSFAADTYGINAKETDINDTTTKIIKDVDIGVNATKDAQKNPLTARLTNESLSISAKKYGVQAENKGSVYLKATTGDITINTSCKDSQSSSAYGINNKSGTTVEAEANNIYINSEANHVSLGISVKNSYSYTSTVNLKALDTISIISNSANSAKGIQADGKNKTSNLEAQNIILNTVGKGTNEDSDAIAVYNVNGATTNLKADTINITTEGKTAYGVQNGLTNSTNASTVKLGNENSVITINATGSKAAAGIVNLINGTTNVNGKSLAITSTATTESGDSIGILAQNNNTDNKISTININTTTTTINAHDALVAFSGSTLNVESDIYSRFFRIGVGISDG